LLFKFSFENTIYVLLAFKPIGSSFNSSVSSKYINSDDWLIVTSELGTKQKEFFCGLTWKSIQTVSCRK